MFAGGRGSLLLTGLVLLVLLLLLSAVLLILPFLTLIRLRTLICHFKNLRPGSLPKICDLAVLKDGCPMQGPDGPGGQVTSRYGFPAILAQLVLGQAIWIQRPHRMG